MIEGEAGRGMEVIQAQYFYLASISSFYLEYTFQCHMLWWLCSQLFIRGISLIPQCEQRPREKHH